MQRLFYAEVSAKNGEHAACERSQLLESILLPKLFVCGFSKPHSHKVRILETSVAHDTCVTK